MIDSFPFGPDGWYAGDAFNPELGAYWAHGGDAGGAYDSTSASTGTWVITILGMLTVLLAFSGWFVYEGRRLSEATERIRMSGRWSVPGGPLEPPPPRSEVSR
jgi:hypothetical protein